MPEAIPQHKTETNDIPPEVLASQDVAVGKLGLLEEEVEILKLDNFNNIPLKISAIEEKIKVVEDAFNRISKTDISISQSRAIRFLNAINTVKNTIQRLETHNQAHLMDQDNDTPALRKRLEEISVLMEPLATIKPTVH